MFGKGSSEHDKLYSQTHKFWRKLRTHIHDENGRPMPDMERVDDWNSDTGSAIYDTNLDLWDTDAKSRTSLEWEEPLEEAETRKLILEDVGMQYYYEWVLQ